MLVIVHGVIATFSAISGISAVFLMAQTDGLAGKTLSC